MYSMKPRRRPYLSPQFSLRTLLFLMLVAGPLGGWGWVRWQAWREWRVQEEARQLRQLEAALLSYKGKANVQAVVNAQAAIGSDDGEVTRSDESFPESDPRSR